VYLHKYGHRCQEKLLQNNTRRYWTQAGLEAESDAVGTKLNGPREKILLKMMRPSTWSGWCHQDLSPTPFEQEKRSCQMGHIG
jgi:hypothetical protein